LIRSYANYLYKEAKLDRKELNTIADEIDRATEENSNTTYYIDLSQYKSPIKTYGNTQLGIGYQMEKGHNSMKLYFLPASNTLLDDNREYFNENLLKLGEVSLLLTDKSVRLESFQLYAMKSLIPWNVFVKGLSGEFRLGLEEHYDRDLAKHVSMNAAGGIGLTRKISEDINAYLLINGGPGFGNSRFYLYFYPEVGVTAYEIMNMKTTLSYKYVYNQLGSKDFYHNFDVTQSFFWQKKFKLSISFERRFNERRSDSTYEMMFHVYF
jgi:hypothetical protein